MFSGTDACVAPVRTMTEAPGDPQLAARGTYVTVDGTVKIGPTAIPAFWRENYHGLEGFSAHDFAEIMRWEATLFLKNSFGFRSLAATAERSSSASMPSIP